MSDHIEVEGVEVPAVVFDAMEKAATQWGGVGGFVSFLSEDEVEPPTIPMCAMGLARWSDNRAAGRAPFDCDYNGPVRNALGYIWGVHMNDAILRDWIEEDSSRTDASRMPWAEYVRRARWIRAEVIPCVHCGGPTVRNRFHDRICPSPSCFGYQS